MPLRFAELSWHYAGTQTMNQADMMETRSEVKHQQWGAEALWQELEPLLPGLCVEVAASVESTNSSLMKRVRAEASRAGADARTFGRRQQDLQPCLLVAERQTQGRGRLGRAWHSSGGASLTFSLAMPLHAQDWSGLSLVVGAALADALDPLADESVSLPRLGLKWPNDLWLDGRKLGGVLIETAAVGERRVAVVGVGLNITPLEIDNPASFSTGFACMQELMPQASGPQVLSLLAKPLVQAMLDFDSSGFAPWRMRYQRRDILRGRSVNAGALQGVVEGVSPQGELLLATPQGVSTVIAGEVSVRLDQTERAPA